MRIRPWCRANRATGARRPTRTPSFVRCRTQGGVQFVDVRDLARLLERALEYTRQQGGSRIVAAGHFSPWPRHVARIRALTGARMQNLRAPGWMLRSLASAVDGVSRLSGRSFPVTREGLEIATRWRAVADSPEIAQLGIAWRDPDETLEDAYRWMLEAGRLPAHAAPRLARSGDGVSGSTS